MRPNFFFMIATSILSGGGGGVSASRLRIPAEWEPHEKTFMVWPSSKEIWGASTLPKVQQDVARIALAISPYEPVNLIVDPSSMSSAQAAFSKRQNNITFLSLPTNDLWARDTLPIFGVEITEPGNESLVGVDLNFNGWGNKQQHDKDGPLASRLLQHFHLPRVSSKLRGEGGGLEFDGDGTLLATESSWVNDNRNRGMSKEQIEAEFKTLFKVDKVVWFKGVKGEDITDAHVDCLVRFVSPGVVLLNRSFRSPNSNYTADDVWSRSSDEAKRVLQKERDAKGRKFTIVEIFEPDPDQIYPFPEGSEDTFVSSYVNFLVVNGAVIMPAFGDEEADEKAKSTLKTYFPEREIVGISIPYLASGGGGIHCATHDVPSVALAHQDPPSEVGSMKSGGGKVIPFTL